MSVSTSPAIWSSRDRSLTPQSRPCPRQRSGLHTLLPRQAPAPPGSACLLSKFLPPEFPAPAASAIWLAPPAFQCAHVPISQVFSFPAFYLLCITYLHSPCSRHPQNPPSQSQYRLPILIPTTATPAIPTHGLLLYQLNLQAIKSDNKKARHLCKALYIWLPTWTRTRDLRINRTAHS